MKNNFIECDYACSLYPRAVIEQAAKDYSDICAVDIELVYNATRCRFSANKASLTLIMHEFSNYLIELINKRNRV